MQKVEFLSPPVIIYNYVGQDLHVFELILIIRVKSQRS